MWKKVASIPAADIANGWQGPYESCLDPNATQRSWAFVGNGTDQSIDTVQWYPRDSKFEAIVSGGNTQAYSSIGGVATGGYVIQHSTDQGSSLGLLGAKCDSFGIHTSATTQPTKGTLDVWVNEFYG